MLISLPTEIWSKILTFIDFNQRIQVCDILISNGMVKIERSLFNTYMTLLEQSKQMDEQNIEAVFIDMDLDVDLDA
tara:strand:+ start:3063 stop:3290 length:228 start_codon:yes stop_codon:yes gene_type:complete